MRKSQCPSHGGQGPRIYWKECLTHKERPEALLKSCSEFWIHTSRPLFSWDVEAKPMFNRAVAAPLQDSVVTQMDKGIKEVGAGTPLKSESPACQDRPECSSAVVVQLCRVTSSFFFFCFLVSFLAAQHRTRVPGIGGMES